MANEIVHQQRGEVVRVRISERMTVADQKALESVARQLIDDGQSVRVLIALVDFHGWEANPGWEEDVEFSFRYASKIDAIAIVGDEQWRQEALLFVGDGFRNTKISYFPASASELAEHWVELP